MRTRVPLGIAIPQIFQDEPVGPGGIRDFLLRAESLGYESGWVQEQILGSAKTYEPIELLTFAAACTTRLRLGSAVLLTALRSPVHTAKSLATLDHLSQGRLMVGVGLGAAQKLYPAFGMTGSRMVGTIANEMLRRRARYGVVTMCIGGGQGAAGLFEACN